MQRILLIIEIVGNGWEGIFLALIILLVHVDYVVHIIKYFAPIGLKLALMGPEGRDGMVLLRQKQTGVWESFFPKTGPFTFALIKNTKQGTADSSILSLMRALSGYTGLLAFYKLDSDYLTVKVDLDGKKTEKNKIY